MRSHDDAVAAAPDRVKRPAPGILPALVAGCAVVAGIVGIAAGRGLVERVAYGVVILATLLALALRALRLPGGAGSAQIVFTVGAGALVGLPALMLCAQPSLAEPAIDVGRAVGFWAAALVGVSVGAALVSPAGGGPARHRMTPRSRGAMFAVLAVSLAGVAILMTNAGGPATFVNSLDESGETTAGLTFAIVMILALKCAALARLHARWANDVPTRISRADIAWLVAALALVGIAGSRLLILVAIAQFVLLALLFGRVSARAVPAGCAVVLLAACVSVGLGELRRWQATPRAVSFPTFLAESGLPRLPRTVVNQYADAVKLADSAMRVVPERASYEGARGLLRVAVHPIPRAIRPTVARQPAVTQAFMSSATSGNALPLPVEGWLQAGIVGALLLSLGFGCLLGLGDRVVRVRGRPAVAFAAACAGASLLIMFRGSLAQGTTLAALDIVSLYAVHRFVIDTSGAAAA